MPPFSHKVIFCLIFTFFLTSCFNSTGVNSEDIVSPPLSESNIFIHSAISCTEKVSEEIALNCLEDILQLVESKMEEEFAKDKLLVKGDISSIEALQKAQESWLKYRESQCDYTFEIHKLGSARLQLFHLCKIRLTSERLDLLAEGK